MKMNFKEQCQELRRQIQETAAEARRLWLAEMMGDLDGESDGQPDRLETMANAELAYRHLEDARMRLGKAIQAYEGGFEPL
jgi:hypothetical protein